MFVALRSRGAAEVRILAGVHTRLLVAILVLGGDTIAKIEAFIIKIRIEAIAVVITVDIVVIGIRRRWSFGLPTWRGGFGFWQLRGSLLGKWRSSRSCGFDGGSIICNKVSQSQSNLTVALGCERKAIYEMLMGCAKGIVFTLENEGNGRLTVDVGEG